MCKAKNEATECIKGLVDINQLQEEMEKAKPTGDLDSVFKKYCKKTPEFKGCVSTFTDSLKPCLEEEEKQGMATVLNVTEQLAEFICYKEGDRIALFIAEGGPECLESSKDDVWKCVETVFKKHIPNTEEVTINDIPLLLFKAEQCKDFHNLQTCVVKQLEKCKEPTPANIIDSLFNFVKKATPCASYKFVDESVEAANKSQAGRTSSFSLSLYAVLIGVTLLRLTASVTH
ncbi:hypothetical protein RUM44_008050 [Polyplax serrata]|uniref:Uncharacterized protein n=1 Tax=Polyplax serrata TaxID=468196 RepID=A0ABR1B7L1_POLSC